MTDPFDVLRSHVRSVALLERPTTDTDELIAEITGAGEPNVAPRSNVVAFRSPRRRRWLVASSALAIVAVGGAGVAAYMGMRPTRPNDGVVCRASADNLSAIVVEPTSDPINACAALWIRGDLPDVDDPRPADQPPRLVACVGANESLEVIPVPALGSCADLGMSDADVGAMSSDPVVELQSVVEDRLNAHECRSAADAKAVIVEALKRLNLESWSVDMRNAAADCVLVAVEPSTARVVVINRPPSNLQETP